MTARDIMTPLSHPTPSEALPDSNRVRNRIDGDAHLLDVLHRLLDAEDMVLSVVDNGMIVGVVDNRSMLSGLGNLLIGRDDCSIVVIECRAQDYSASMIAQAVEDAEAHLFDLMSRPAEDGMIRATLRVGHSDPSAVVRSIERYNMTVVAAYGSNFKNMEILQERLNELAIYLNV